MPAPYDEENRWRDRLRAGASGATFGFGDEIEAGLSALAQLDPSAYRNEVERIRSQQAAYEEAHPYESMAWEVGGSVLPSLAMPATGLARALPSAARLAVRGGAAGKAAFRAAPVVAESALYGVGSAEDIGDIPRSVAEEAALGLGMYGAGHAAAPYLRRAGSAALAAGRNAVEAVAGGDTRALRALEQAFRAGASLEELQALAQQLGASVDPVALRINVRLRDEAAAAGTAPHPDVGRFVPKEVDFDPADLRVFREGQRAALERQLAEKHNLPDVLASLAARPTGGAVPAIGRARPLQATSAPGVHISRVEGLTQTDPSFFGTGHRGTEVPMVHREGLPSRTYFYSGEPGTISPEPEVMGRNSPRFAYTADLQNLYDVNADPDRLVALARAYNMPDYEPALPYWALQDAGVEGASALPDLERMVADRGYSGYISDFGPSWAPASRRAVASYQPVDVTPTELREKYMNGGYVG